jgi:hypothetical protein
MNDPTLSDPRSKHPYTIRTQLRDRALIKSVVNALNEFMWFRGILQKLMGSLGHEGKSKRELLSVVHELEAQIRQATKRGSELRGLEYPPQNQSATRRVRKEAAANLASIQPPDGRITQANEIRARAEELTLNGLGDTPVLKRAQIERIIQAEFEISRDRAQSFATKAVRRLDPGNPLRRTHKVPIARRVNAAQIDEFRRLHEIGMQINDISKALGANARTIRIHLKKHQSG